jgi:antitoxin component of RelBE/YafQ-DinJ toxin-antitoxin module
MTTDVNLAAIWEEMRDEFAAIRAELITMQTQLETIQAQLNGLPFAPLTPNAETIAAMEAARRGEFTGEFASGQDLIEHFHPRDRWT